jgi:tetratricopeptide (TPR) repeat protein
LHPGEIGALVALIDQARLGEAEQRALALLGAHADVGILWKILGVALLRQGKEPLPALRRAALLLPKDAEAQGNLGLALHDRGEWKEALESLERALRLGANDEQVLTGAAHCLRALGRAQESVPLYRQALEIQRAGIGGAGPSRYADTLDVLGNVLRDLGDLHEAIASYREAVERDPTRAASHCNLGNALLEAGRVDEAAASCARAVTLDPASALARLSLATACRLLGRVDEAESGCRAALELDPHYVEALSLLGELRADEGRFADAEQLFQRALALDPEFPFAYCGIAAHRRMTRADQEWLDGASRLLEKRPPLRHAINLHHALGKYFDDVELYDEAFGHHRQAHELGKRYGSRYDSRKLTRRIDRVISLFDASFLNAAASRGSSSTLPVFVVGMPRSGTTLAEQILASHPSVFGAGEMAFWEMMSQGHDAQGLEANAVAARLPEMAEDYLRLLRSRSGTATRVIDKLPANFLSAGLMHAAFPEARIIHMRRHPIDTCLSIYFQSFFNMGPYANELAHLADYYGQYVRVTDHWRRVLPPARLLEVPYEGLVEDAEGWTRRMLDFIGLPWDPQCLDFHQAERTVITASRWQVRQKIHHRSVGRWRHYEKHVGPLRGLASPEP